MPFVHYSATQKAEAIALARVMGVEEAATRTGIGVASIRTWSKAAGVSPDVDEDLLQSQYDLALAMSAEEIASRKVRGHQLSIRLGILADKIRLRGDRERERANAVSGVHALDAREAFSDWLADEALAGVTLETEADGDAAEAALDAVQGELLRLANAEDEPRAHRTALLGWHSGRADWGGTPIPAGDVLEWAQAETRDLIATHGSLSAWHDARQAEVARAHAEWRAGADDLRAEAWARYAGCAPGGRPNCGQPTDTSEPIDVEALLAEADAYLEEIAADQMALPR